MKGDFTRGFKQLYERRRNRYIRDIDALIMEIKGRIDTTITECKEILRTARAAIETMVSDNAGIRDKAAQAALKAATAGFDRMQTRIESTARTARRALDAERKKAIAAMNKELDAIRSENAGLVDKIAGAIAALAAALGKFLALMTRITRMGVGSFLAAALAQARDGVRNNLWSALKDVFREWLFMKLPALQLLMNLPPNWIDMLVALGTSLPILFQEHLPQMLPAIGVAAMIWLATTLAAKLIPGVGAIMVVVDALRAAYSLVASLLSAAGAFFDFVMRVAASGNGAVAFAKALAFGIIAGIDAVLTFLGVDRLIRRVIGAIAKPVGRIFKRLGDRFKALFRRRKGKKGKPADAPDGGKGQDRGDTSAKKAREDRKKRERLDHAVTAIRPRAEKMLRKGVSRLRFNAALVLWRARYRLSSLKVEGKTLRARVNPAENITIAEMLHRQKIGRELEPILAEAEASFYRSAGTSAAYDRAANETGNRAFRDTMSPQNLPAHERIRYFQDVASGAIPSPIPKDSDKTASSKRYEYVAGILRPGGEGFSTRMNPAHSTNVNLADYRAGKGKFLLSQSHVLGASTYDKHRALPKAEQLRKLGTPSTSGLVYTLERARQPGLGTAGSVADALAQGTPQTSALDVATGPLAPLAHKNAAKVSEYDQGLRNKKSLGLGDTEIETSRAARREAIGAIFRRLEKILDNPPVELLVMPGTEINALKDLAQAFRNWLKHALPSSGG